MRIFAQIGMAVWLQIWMCVVSLVFAGRFAWRGGPRRLRVLVALAVATTFATLGSVCMGLAMVGRSSARMAAAGAANLVPNLLVGTGEAMGGGLLGFATLTLVAILAAIGLARGQTAAE
jgi:hypothetical protein